MLINLAGVNISKFNIIQNIIQRNSSNFYFELKGGIDDSTGARLMLFSTGYSDSTYSGSFELISRNINSQYYLRENPDGTLIWNDNNLSDIAVKLQLIQKYGLHSLLNKKK